ncbi:MAG: hypothetical protein IKM44_04450, partial [Clostridia bacterium]|nr:hypothetical protein [Clostridia bacterium]
MASRRRIDGSFDEDHNGELRKRKKGGCLTKILIRLGITVGSIAVLIVGALIAGNIVLGNMFGVSLFDLFGVFGDMGANRTEIVANPYTNEDEKGFYDAANDMLYFKSGAEAVLDSEYVHELLGNIPDGNTDSMFDSLLSLLSADNFDKTKLSAYKGWQESVTHLSTLPTITDRQFAAFIKDALLDSGMLDDMLGSALSEIGVANLSDVASIDQVIISKQSAVTRSGADDVMMKLTVSLNVEELVNAIMKHFELEFLGGVLNFFLPDETFLSATVNMSDASDGLKLAINALDNQTCNVTAKEEILAKYGDGKGSVTKMERIFVIIESFSGVDVLKTIEDSVKPMLGYFCKGAETETPFCFADLIDLNSVKSNADGSNSFKLDLFGMLTDLLNTQTGGASQPEDVVVLMQALLCTESEPVYKDDYAHRADLYYDPTGADLAQALASIGKTTLSEITTKAEYDALKKAYGKISYDDFGVTLGAAYVSAYCDEFMDALAKTYCLDLGDYTFYDVLGLLGFSDGNEAMPKFTDLVDGHRLAELAKPENQSDVMKVTDRMLGAIVIELLPELLGSEFEKYDMQLRTVAITERVVESVSHSMLTLKFTVDLSGLIEGDVAEYIGDLVPQAVTFGVTVDMTVGMSKENKLPAEIACFNDVTESGTATVLNGLTTGNILSAIERIIPDVDLDKLLSMVSDSLAEVTTGLNEALPYYAFRPSVANNAGYVELPSVFDIAVEFLGLNEE